MKKELNIIPVEASKYDLDQCLIDIKMLQTQVTHKDRSIEILRENLNDLRRIRDELLAELQILKKSNHRKTSIPHFNPHMKIV